MAVSRATNWRNKLNIAELLEEKVEWQWEKEEAGHYVGHCPLCQYPGFKVRVKGGRWLCANEECNWHALPATGDIDSLIGWATGMPTHKVRTWLAKSVGHSISGEDPLPDKTDLTILQIDRQAHKYPMVDKYIDKHAISETIALKYGLGADTDGRLTIPIYDRDLEIFNLKSIAVISGVKNKCLVRRGHGHILFPWQHVLEWNTDNPIVITEGEPDALCLLSLRDTEGNEEALNVCTTTGGAACLTPRFLPYSLIPAGSKVILCMDNDEAGRKAQAKLLYSLKKHDQTIEIRAIVLPEEFKDISDLMREQSPENRGVVWEKLVSEAKVWSKQTFTHRGMFESAGCTMKTYKDEPYRLAPFTGCIIEWGNEIRAGVEGKHGCKIEALHFRGQTLKFRYAQGDDFRQVIEKAGGPEWNIISKKEGEEVYHYIAEKINQGGEVKRINFGWQFGFKGKDFDKFYSPEVIYTEDGAKKNVEMLMETELNFLSRLKLPHPEPDKVQAGVRLLWGSAYKSHMPRVSAPLLVAAIMAPVRRLIAPKEDPHMVFVRGQTQACKTTRAKVYQSLYGDYWDHQDLVGFQGTVKTIEHQVELAGDCYMVLDDLKMERFNEHDRRYLYQFLQNTAQGGGRDRMTRDGAMQQAAKSYCIKVITCEVLPMADQSLLGRSLIIDTPRIEPHKASWKRPHDYAEDHRDLLPFALSGWIDHCIQTAGSMARKYQDLRKESEAVVRNVCEGESGEHYQCLPQIDRIVNRLTMYTVFHFLFLDWSREQGLPLVDVGILREEWDSDVLPALFNTMMEALSEGGAANEFILALESAVRAGKVTFMDERSRQLVPSAANHNAPKIGFIRPLDGRRRDMPEYALNSVDCGGTIANCCIDSGVASMPWNNGQKGDWVTARQYLQDNNLATPKRTGRDGKFLILATPVAARILAAVRSHEMGATFTETEDE